MRRLCVVLRIRTDWVLYLRISTDFVLYLRMGADCVLYLRTGTYCVLYLGVRYGCVVYLRIGTDCVLYLRIGTGCELYRLRSRLWRLGKSGRCRECSPHSPSPRCTSSLFSVTLLGNRPVPRASRNRSSG